IKSNLSYILIAFFLIVGFVSYILKLKFLRNIILLFSLIFLGFYLGGCPCIVGSTFNIFNLKNANIIYFILLSLIPILTSFIWGRWFCGWFCPIGAFQKFIYSIKPKNPDNLINKAIIKINGFLKKNDKLLKYLKIFIFIIFGYLYISKGYNLFCHYEPFKVIFAFNGSLINISIAFFIFLFASFNERLFCKYLCPLAGILKFTSKLSIKKVKVDSKLCTECKICTKDLCPTDAIKCDEKNNKIIIDNGECIRCLKCEDLCRTKSLSLK
ncbi:MAG: 4Fe-4S binding protein, partial [Spirochaetota bacterium]